MPKPLSPAAQVISDAFWSHPDGKPLSQDSPDTPQLAAALRAAADQVAPARPVLDSCCEHFEQAIRHKLLAIAAELAADGPAVEATSK